MSSSPYSEDAPSVRITPDEALVLFELLTRWSDDNGEGDTPSADCFQTTAEPAVLSRLLGSLERQLVTPFRADYAERLRDARQRLSFEWEYRTLRG